MRQNIYPLLIFYFLHFQDGAATDEKTLYSALFDSSTGYNPKVRPRLNSLKPVDVSVELEIGQIQDLDEKNQVLSIVGFITAVWNDEYLSWSPSAYGGIKMMVVPPKYVWLPDFGVVNSADSFYNNDFTTDFRVQLFHTGNISWSFGGVFRTMCSLDNTYYPLDLQHCTLDLENWAYTSDQVDLHLTRPQVDLENYLPHGIWQISNTRITKKYLTFLSHPGETFPEMIFELDLKRKSTYYVLNILTPCALIVIVALTVYWLPPDAGEKVSFGVTVLLAFSVFQLVIAEQTPVNSDYSPKLTLLVLAVMGLSSFSVVISVLILYLHNKSTATRVPRWLRVLVFRGVASILCMRTSMPGIEDEDWKVTPENDGPISYVRNYKQNANSDLAEITASLRFITRNIKEKKKDERILGEWQSLGKVIDRLLFWVSLIVIVIIASLLLGQSDPDHKK